jgi:hypothetical protein
VLTGALDTRTGDIFFGQNTGVPDPLAPELQTNLSNFEGPGDPFKGVPGAHSEINALNQGLFARAGWQLSDFLFVQRQAAKITSIGADFDVPELRADSWRCQ